MPEINIVRIKLRISYAFLIQSERPILVDTGSPGETGKIEAALSAAGVRLADLALILHTHGHMDHCGSTAELKQKHSTPAAIHPGDADLLRRKKDPILIPTRFFGKVLLRVLNFSFPPVEPEVLVDEGFSLEPYGVAARIVATPGHTAGSISVVFDDGRAIVGDLMMGGYLGGVFRPREPDYHYFAEDLATVRESIRKLIRLHVKVFFPGHGGPLSAEGVVRRFSSEIRF